MYRTTHLRVDVTPHLRKTALMHFRSCGSPRTARGRVRCEFARPGASQHAVERVPRAQIAAFQVLAEHVSDRRTALFDACYMPRLRSMEIRDLA